jgi:hypothetical protein
MPVIGFLRTTSASEATEVVTAFRQGLNDAGNWGLRFPSFRTQEGTDLPFRRRLNDGVSITEVY